MKHKTILAVLALSLLVGQTLSHARLATGSVDIEVEQESQGPFARWRIRNGQALIFVEKLPAGPTSCRITGPELSIEVGARPGFPPNFHIRGQWSDAITADAVLTNVLFGIIRSHCF